MKKRVISTILVAAIMCMSTLSAFAVDKSEHEGRTNQMTVEETFTQKTVSANIDGKRKNCIKRGLQRCTKGT